MNKKRKIIVIIFIIIIIIGVSTFLFNLNSKDTSITENQWTNLVKPEKNIEDLLVEKGNEFYKKYYDGIADTNSLANFSEIGISVDFNRLDMVISLDDNIKQILNDKVCDYEKSKLVFYPEAPFGGENYKIKVELNCQK